MEQPGKPQVDRSSSHADQETRRQILTKAADLFLAKGYKGVSMKEIAEAVQVTSAALYYHFPQGKEDLFTKMIQTVFVDEVVAGIDQLLSTTHGVDLEGNKEVLTLRACAEESKDGWSCLLQDVRQRGATQIDLIVTDGHEGILSAVAALFAATPRQRCVVHKQRNVMNAIPHRERKEVGAELAGIFKQEKKEEARLNLIAFKAKYQKRYPEAIRSLCEDEEYLLTYYDFPPVMHRYIRTTNAIESFFSNVRQRTDQIDAFTTETSCLTIVWAVMQDLHLPRIPIS